MRITATPYTDEEIDPAHPLGRISFEGVDQRQLSIDSAWIDEWLSALVSATDAVRKTASGVQIDVDSEREPLVWFSDAHTASFTFRGKTILVGQIAEFREELRRSILEVTDTYVNHPNWARCSTFKKVRAWAKEASS